MMVLMKINIVIMELHLYAPEEIEEAKENSYRNNTKLTCQMEKLVKMIYTIKMK